MLSMLAQTVKLLLFGTCLIRISTETLAIQAGSLCILLSKTNKMQRYTIFFIIVDAVYVSGGFSAHHQETKNCTHSIGYVYSFWSPDDGRRNRLKHVENWL
jgi:hypothetical protein